MTCPATRLSDAPNPCSARFCTRLCLQRAISHPMLCVAQNPAIVPLLSLSRQYQWQALVALASCASRIMLATSAQDQREAFSVYESLAYVEPGSPLWRQIIRPSEEQLESGYTVYTSALAPGEIKPAPTPTLRKTLKAAPPIPENMQKELFSPEGFRRGMARMNLSEPSLSHRLQSLTVSRSRDERWSTCLTQSPQPLLQPKCQRKAPRPAQRTGTSFPCCTPRSLLWR